MYVLNYDKRILSTLLAALRYWQLRQTGESPGDDYDDIATDCGAVAPLSPDEVDELCDRINSTPAVVPHSQRFSQFLSQLRSSGSDYPVTDHHCALLIADALDLLQPLHDDECVEAQLQAAAENLASDFRVLAEELEARS